MHPLALFEPIMIEPPHERIYRRLGYRRGVTSLPVAQEAEVQKYIAQALDLIRLRGMGRRVPLGGKNDNRVVLLTGGAGEEIFQSRRLARFLDACDESLLMGATAGSEIMTAIAEDVAGNRVTRGVVFDAVASEMVDAALDWIMSYFARELRRENRMLTDTRFSAGYGDFLLENQRVFFQMLEMERIGVQLADSFVLIPEKSVTALAGAKVM